MKMSKAESWKLGAIALSHNKEMKIAATKKAAETIKTTRPDFYKEIGRVGGLAKKKKRYEENINV
jgi:general stress protein YciG